MTGQTRRQHIVGLSAAAALLGSGEAEAVELTQYFDTWSGMVDTGAGKVRLELDILSKSAASIVHVDQGGEEIKARQVKLTPDSVLLEFADGSRFAGALGSDDFLKGTFTLAGNDLPLEFERGELFIIGEPIEFSQDALSKARKSSGAPALGAAFSRGGAPATILVDGLRSSRASLAVTPEDQWHLGSITKSMTATLVARLVEAHKVSWDASVGDVLGPLVPNMKEAYKAVTFRHLLSHHAGLQRDIENKDWPSFERLDPNKIRTERFRYVGLALRQTPANAPGGKMLYSNNGYVIAGAMLEALCDQSWETLIADYVFSPLGLKSAGLGVPGTPGKLDQPLGHTLASAGRFRLVPEPVDPFPDVDGPAGAGYMSLADIIAYLNAHLLKPAGFLGAESWKTLHTPPFRGHYAMGWYIDDRGRLSHGGTIGSWYAEVTVDTSLGAVAAAVTNDGDFEKVVHVVGGMLEGALKRAAA